MTPILMNLWLAFNIIFGIWSARNWLLWALGVFLNKSYNQSNIGQMLDLIIPVSILTYWFTI